MSSRRKMPPVPLAKPDPSAPPRALAAATVRTFALPTVAALLMVAAAGCSSPSGSSANVGADPVARRPIASSTTMPTTASTIGGKPIEVPTIDPEPHALGGDVAMVVPTPPTTKPVTPKPPPPPPIPKPHHLGGAAMPTHTF